jgi:hypothetical protein
VIHAPEQAVSGTVNLTLATATEIDGSFTIPLEAGVLTGTFSAPYCVQAGGVACVTL